MDDKEEPKPAQTGQWRFNPGGKATQPVADQPSSDALMPHPDDYVVGGDEEPDDAISNNAVTWNASEYIAHHKSFGWYGMLVLVSIVVILGVYLLTRDKITTALFVLVAITFGATAGHKPRTLQYKLDGSGLQIDNKFYAYTGFRSFAVLQEGAFQSIVFMPLKRFMPMLTIYFDPKDAQKITNILADRLPMEVHKLDPIDQLLRRVRF